MLGRTHLQNGETSLTQDYTARQVLCWSSRQRGTKEAIQWLHDLWLSSMVHLSWKPWLLLSHYQPCFFSFKTPTEASSMTKGAGGRITSQCHQSFTRLSTVAAALMPTNSALVLSVRSMSAIYMDHTLIKLHSRSQAMIYICVYIYIYIYIYRRMCQLLNVLPSL